MLFMILLSFFVRHGLCTDPLLAEIRNESAISGMDLNNCIDLGNVTKFAHIGWLFQFESDDIISPAKDANFTIYRQHRYSNAMVTLFNADGTVSWSFTDDVVGLRYDENRPYEKFEVSENVSLPFLMVYEIPEINYCTTLELFLEYGELAQNATCTEEEAEASLFYATYRGSFSVLCTVNFENFPYIFADEEDLQYEWWHNCSKNFPENVRGATSRELTISQVEFYNGGQYTCAITYKGQRRFLQPHDLCVRHGNSGTYTIKCEENIEGHEGENLNITCVVDFGKGNSFSYQYRMVWMKMSDNGTFREICGAQHYEGLLNSTDGDPKIQCENVRVEVESNCFRYVPPIEQQIAPDRTFRLTMLINDFERSDVGNYLLNFIVFSNDFQNHTFTVSLNEDHLLTSRAIYVAIAAGIVVLLAVLVAICVWRRIDIRWFFKKNFGAYEEDDKQYMAYLAYHYSKEGMKESTQNLTRNVVQGVTGFIEKLKGTTYDDHRDGDPTQQQVDNISKFQQDCHRIIVILNEEYITDQWNMHKVYFAMQTMIEEGTKVIFIVLPGVKKSFQGLADEPRTALKHAMKMSTTINWSGEVPLAGSFRRQLEYALPKLRNGKNKARGHNNNNDNRMQTVV